MELWGSLPHSQAPTTCPCPEPDKSIPCFWIPLLWRSILIFSFHLCLGLPSGLFSSGLLIKTLYTPLLSPIHATCPAHLIIDLIIWIIFGESADHKAPNYVVFLIPLLPHQSYSEISSSAWENKHCTHTKQRKLLASHQTAKLEAHPLSAYHNCIFWLRQKFCVVRKLVHEVPLIWEVMLCHWVLTDLSQEGSAFFFRSQRGPGRMIHVIISRGACSLSECRCCPHQIYCYSVVICNFKPGMILKYCTYWMYNVFHSSLRVLFWRVLHTSKYLATNTLRYMQNDT